MQDSFSKDVNRHIGPEALDVPGQPPPSLRRHVAVALATIMHVLRMWSFDGELPQRTTSWDRRRQFRTKKEYPVRYSPWLMFIALILGGLLGAGSLAPAAAQEATPTAAIPPAWNLPGIEVIASISDPSLAPGMVLEFDRITWAPGFVVPMHYHPAIDIMYVVSGSVAWSVEDGTAQVSRAAADGTPATTETLEPGNETILGPGDVIIFDYPQTGMRHSARVVGDEPVIMLDPVLYDPSKDLTQFPEGVTPVPEG